MMQLRRHILTPAFALLALAPQGAGLGYGQQLQGPEPVPPEVTVTRHRVMSIPFDLHAATEHTREVQLMVSADGGVSWNVEKVAAPREGQFEFSAPRDGEYWFAVRTIDRLGNAIPDGTPEPEARLAIDSTPPHLQLQASMDADGQLVARWQANDPRLQEGSLLLEYRAVGDIDWLPFPLDPLTAATGNSTSGGRISWLPPVDGNWELRASIADTAGNQATIVESSSAAENTAPNATANSPDTQLHSALQQTTNPLPIVPPRATNLHESPVPSLLPAGHGRRGADEIKRNDEFNQDWTAASQRGTLGNRTHSNPAPPTTTNTQQNPFPAANPIPYRPIGLVSDAADNATDRDLEPRGLIPGGIGPNVKAIGADEPVLYVNALQFVLEFDPRPASIALDAMDANREIEAWGTVNGGQTWRRFASGFSNEGQLTVDVSAPGRYGFRLIEIDRSSLQMPPRSGDQPEVWVVVDLSPPVCQLINATQGDDAHLDELTITWNASDEQLAAAAITLQYAPSPAGPWETIVQGVENTGSYLWRMGGNVPPHFHLRLLAQDLAGNYGQYISRVPVEPVRRDFGRITGVRPADTARPANPDQTGSFHSAQRNQ